MLPASLTADRLPTFTTERLVLRHLAEHDVPALFAIFSDPQVMRFWSSAPLASIDAASSLLREIHAGLAEGSLFQWGIAERGTVVGTFTLYHIDFVHRRAEIGFALRRSAWGRGLAQEAVRRGVEFAFTELDLHRIEADADPRNSGSIALLEALGFRNEGLLRERYFVNGEIQDALYFGLLRREYVARSPSEPRDGRAVVAPD